MIQSIDQQFISSQSSSKRGKILVQPHFIVRLNFLSQIIPSNSNRTHGTKPPLRQFFTKISIVHRLKMQAQILLSLLFAASVCGRPTGREIAQVSFMKKNFGKILFGRKKNWVGSSKTDSTTIFHPSQVGQQPPKRDDIDFFQAGLRARGLKSHVAPKYCTLDKSEDFFRYLGYQVS